MRSHDDLAGLTPVLDRRVGIIRHDLEIRPDHRQGRAEIMRGLRQKALLGLERARQSVEHGIEGRRHPGELVVGAIQRDPAIEIRCLDVAGHHGDLVERPEAAVRDDPADDQRHDEQAQQDDGDPEGHLVEHRLLEEALDAPHLPLGERDHDPLAVDHDGLACDQLGHRDRLDGSEHDGIDAGERQPRQPEAHGRGHPREAESKRSGDGWEVHACRTLSASR
jgi:hypothetical protein